jgi:hypothetical protein
MWDTIGSIYYAVMIFSVPAAIVTLLFSVAAISEADEEKYLKYSFAFVIIFLMSFAFEVYGNGHLNNIPWEEPEKPQAVEKIVSLSDNNLMSGKLYLRRGYIEQDLWYQYMVKLNDGGFVANKVKSTDTTLYYSDGDYRVEWYTKERHWLWFYEKENYHKIFIPAGSITDEYSIDLK